MFNSLQAGRGIAAIAVLLFHLGIGVETMTGVDVFPLMTNFGDRGVDFFFVLSGFIIMLAHHKDIGRPEQWSRFAYKRFARIYPAYWIYTAIVVIGALFWSGAAAGFPQSPADWFSTITLIRVSDLVTPIGPGWTLFHEMMFYAAFSVLIFNRYAGIALMALWFGACAIFGEFQPGNVYSPYTTAITALNLDFLMGMVAFWASRRIQTERLAIVTALAGLLVLIATVALTGREILPEEYLYGPGFALLIAGSTSFERHRTINIPAMTFLGNASYSIYLVHQTALTIGYYPIAAMGVTDPYLLYAFGGSFGLVTGIAAYLLVEKPMMRLMRPTFATKTAKSPDLKLQQS